MPGCIFSLLLATLFILCPGQIGATPQTIRVVMDDNYPPYVFKGQSGKLQGITIDQWRLWQEKTGVNVEIVATDWALAQERMQAGEFDVIDTIFRNKQREKIYAFTKPYAELPVPLFVHRDISGIRGAEDLSSFVVAVKQGGAVIDFLTRQGASNIVEYPSYEKIVEAARDGKVKIFTEERPPALYFLSKLGILDQFRETDPMYTGQFHRAVAKDNPQLLAQVEDGFARISAAEYQAIDERWRGSALPTPTYAAYVQYATATAAILLTTVFFWLLALKKVVRQKTRALAESEGLYRSLVENLPLGIALITPERRIKMVNRKQAEMFGHPQNWFVGRRCFHEFEKRDHVCEHCPGAIAIKTGKIAEIETEGLTDNGKKFKARIHAVPLNDTQGHNQGFIEVVEDITERRAAEDERKKLTEENRAMERQLFHTQKLESLGVLAGGIAHDFNNLLAAIIGNAELGKRRMNPESPAVTNLERIEQAAERAADLAKQMLAYSGKGKFVVEPLDLNLLLEEMLHMLQVSISKKAVLRFNLHRPLPSVEADATQIRQILMNLVINASEAISDKSGVIALTTGCMDCDDSYLHQVWLDENLHPGLYVYLEVADTGCGMSKETLAKLFDPFFTTKFTGRGLGMAAVMGIVRGHKGAIRVYSEVDKGTTFKILLPASSSPAELCNDTTEKTNWQGSGKILLVDDEASVRDIGVEMLTEVGFETITATDGRDALEKFQQHPDIDAVILDLTMPKMDGEQCFRELRRLDPDIKVIMSSGYSEQEVSQHFLGKGLAGFIQKPYKLSTLQDVLQKAQGGHPEGDS